MVIMMRDGVNLAADIHGELTARPRPVVLERTPYGRQNPDQPELHGAHAGPVPRTKIAAAFNAAGFIYVIGDCRGTGQSQGTFTKYLQECDDGVDTIAWLRDQPWCDGRIATTGFSYGALCQMAAIAAGATVQAALFDCGGFFDAHESGIRQGGAFDLKQATWTHAQAIRDALASGDDEGAQALKNEDVRTWLNRGPWTTGHSPLDSAPHHLSNLMHFWQSGEFGPIWQHPALYAASDVSRLSAVPAMFVTSWFDTSLLNGLQAFTAVTKSGAMNQQLIIGPWNHNAKHTTLAGATDLGPEALPQAVLGAPLSDYRVRWFEQMVSGGQQTGPAVRYFEMGGGEGKELPDGTILHGGSWQSSDSWPPQDCRTLQLFVCDGELCRDKEPEINWRADWVSDPDKPVETLGGAINSGEPVMQGGMFDHSAEFPVTRTSGKVRSTRPDVVTLTTRPLTEDLHVVGPVEADLHVSADVVDADVTIKLIDCYPDDGPCLNVTDGILRLRYRAQKTVSEPLVPGKINRIRVQAFPTANRFQAGHRLRLDIAASNFPHFDVNPQTGGPEGLPGARRIAQLTLHSGPGYPSKLNLSVKV